MKRSGALQARIYRPTKTAMQSGRARTRHWVLEFAPQSQREVEPLMGWTSSRDTRSQLRLLFETKERAVAFAQRRGLDCEIEEPHERRIQPKSYAENFS
jgi:hypothetical protein